MHHVACPLWTKVSVVGTLRYVQQFVVSREAFCSHPLTLNLWRSCSIRQNTRCAESSRFCATKCILKQNICAKQIEYCSCLHMEYSISVLMHHAKQLFGL